MRIQLSGVLSLLVLLLPLTPVRAQQDQFPPTARIVVEDFSPMREAWQPALGTWSVANGTYGNSTGAGTSISRITEYRRISPSDPPDSEISYDEFFVSARMRNQGTDNTHLVGLIYGYQDTQNYYEVVISALGRVTMRTVMNGIAVAESPALDTGIPRNTWFQVEVRWNRGVSSLKVDGITVVEAVSQPEFTSGDIGLVTHATTARFDKVFLGVPIGDQSFLETFDEPPFVTFEPLSGQWSVVDGTYRNSAIQQTTLTLAPFHTGVGPGSTGAANFTFRARMLNPYSNTGNLVGFVFNYAGNATYSEVVFSPTGIARVNRVRNGAVETLATASYGGSRNVAFEVTLENTFDFVSVLVNGVRLFANVPAANPSGFPEGGVGLITHWAPGRFDNVQFDRGVFRPCTLPFAEPLRPDAVVSGVWNQNGGTLNSTAAGQSDIVKLDIPCGGNGDSVEIGGEDAGTNMVYSARLLNEYGASGNLVGLVYNYQLPFTLYAGDYFEIVFSPTGTAQINKFIQGVRYPVASRSHNIPRNTWFDVQVIRTGAFTDVRVNGATFLQLVRQGELRGGSVGVITHWSKGRFDDVTLRSRVTRPPSQL
jgi:hypothetical protein